MSGRGFAHDTAVRMLADGQFGADIQPGWDIGGNANGGYLLAIAARAIAGASGRPDPITLTAHYLAPGRAGPLDGSVELLKEGRQFSVATARLAARGKPLLAVLGSFGDLAQQPEDPVHRIEALPPELPSPDSCFGHDPARGAPPMTGRVDLRLHPDDAGFISGRPSGEMRVRGWFRLPDDEPMDTLALLLAVDAFPPTSFNGNLPVAWTPTVELTVHVRARPAPGWLRASFTTRFVSGGFLEEDGEIWDADGRLVAQSRQLALLPRR